MKIPRLKKGPFCWTVEQWAKQMAFSDVILGIIVISFCFYANSYFDDLSLETREDKDLVQVVKSIFIGVGSIICFLMLFAIILIIGLFSRNTKLLLIWLYYAMIRCAIFIILFIAAGIFLFAKSGVALGVVMLVLGVAVGAQQGYSVAIVHTVYLNIKEAELQTSHAQQS